MHSRRIPISSSFLLLPPPTAPPSIPMANATRQSTRRPSCAKDDGEEEETRPMDVDIPPPPCGEEGSEARRAARSLGVVERFATTTAACLRAGLCRVSTRRRAEAEVRSRAAFDAPSRDSCRRSWSVGGGGKTNGVNTIEDFMGEERGRQTRQDKHACARTYTQGGEGAWETVALGSEQRKT